MTVSTLLWIIGCILIADFITGFAHWFEDTFITLDTPLVKEAIAIPNIEHHRRPGLMAGRESFYGRNKVSMALALAAVSLSLVCGLFSWQLLLVCVLAMLGNEVHEWNHSPKPRNALIAFIQDSGMVQTRRQHALHHKAPYDRYYCTLTNFTNAVLERISFWRGLEWVFVNILQMRVQRLSPARQGY